DALPICQVRIPIKRVRRVHVGVRVRIRVRILIPSTEGPREVERTVVRVVRIAVIKSRVTVVRTNRVNRVMVVTAGDGDGGSDRAARLCFSLRGPAGEEDERQAQEKQWKV